MQNESDITQIISKRIPAAGAASSNIGGRPENQDCYAWSDTPIGLLIVVCDGMGGGPGGRTASQLATITIMQQISTCPKEADRSLALRKAVAQAEEVLEAKMREVPSLRGMGTTLVALLINEDSAMIAHLGDSRCYRIREGHILFRTEDHSLVGELVKANALTEEQARLSPQSNVITRGLGNTSNHTAEIDKVPYRAGDRFVICTDGVWGAMSQNLLLTNIGLKCTPANIVRTLQKEVDRIGISEGGHHDNHTLVILDLSSNSILKDKMNKQIKIALASLIALLLLSIIVNVLFAIRISQLPTIQEFEEAKLVAANSAETTSIIERVNEKTLRTNAEEIEKLKQNMYSLESEIEVLRVENDSLYKLNDSLRNTLNNLNNKIAMVSNKHGNNNSSTKPGFTLTPLNALSIAKEIMNGLNKMKTCKYKVFKTACQKQAETKTKLSSTLRDFNKATDKKYNKIVSEMQTILNGKDVGYIEQKDDKFFYPTYNASNLIDRLINQFETIKKQLK